MFSFRSFPLLCLIVFAITPSVRAAEPAADTPASDALTKLKDMPTPTLAQLLSETPRDWIVLDNDDVLVVDSLKWEPKTLELRKQAMTDLERERVRVFGEKREQLDREREQLEKIIVTLPENADRLEFQLPVRLIKQIIHHEDLMLERFEILLKEQHLDQAYELLTRLERTRPDWNGIDAAGEKLISYNAIQRMQNHQPEAALALLDELHRRNPKFPELSSRIGTAVRTLVENALRKQDNLRAQYFLHHLQKVYPKHAVYREFATALTKQAEEKMQAATAAAKQKNHREAMIEAEQAVRIWPLASELRAPHEQIAKRYQRLHVGVTDLPGECVAYPLPGPADQRRDRLTKLTLFEIDRFRDGTAYYRTRFFDDWEPRDLGRKMHFTLRQHRQPFDIQAVLTTPEILAPLRQRLDPDNSAFDERLAAFIESIEVDSPTEFSLTFRRVPARMEPLLSHISLLSSKEGRPQITDFKDPGGFRLQLQTARICEYVRQIPEPDGLSKYHIAEVVEHRYDSPERVVQGLRNGEVSMVFDLPDVLLRPFQNEDELSRQYFVQPRMQPLTHLLQFNPASAALKTSEFRKALSYAIDYDTILKDVVLQDTRSRHGRRITTPFFSKNPGRNMRVPLQQYDLSRAYALLLAAKQKLKGTIPPLTMIVAPGKVPTSAAREIAKTWRRLGLEINVVRANEPQPEHWDVLYRTLRMSEPVLDLWPFLTFEDRARINDLNIYPDWLKQEVVELERTGDQSRAVDALQTLHRHLSESTAFIPLWEIDQFIVLRKNIRGFPTQFVHCYADIDHWNMQDWYRTELP